VNNLPRRVGADLDSYVSLMGRFQ